VGRVRRGPHGIDECRETILKWDIVDTTTPLHGALLSITGSGSVTLGILITDKSYAPKGDGY
jgi:hypothetical protein